MVHSHSRRFLFEKNEGLSVTLANPTNGAQLGGRSQAKVQIVNDDAKQPGKFEFANAAYTVIEGTPTIQVTINRTDGGNVRGRRAVVCDRRRGTVPSAVPGRPTILVPFPSCWSSPRVNCPRLTRSRS